MKKVLLLAVSLMITIMANAQVSVQMGFVLNTLKSTVKVENTDVGRFSGSYRGLMAVVDYNIHLTDYLGVAPGLGIDYSFNNQSGLRDRELGLFAPVDINYCLSMNDSFSLTLFAGPTFYYGLFSKNINTNYDYFENESKRFDVSLGGGFWIDVMEHIRVKVGYKFGMLDISKIANITGRSNFLSISVGYVF